MRRLAVLVLVALALAGAPRAQAHALLTSSEPADGQSLDDPPAEITLTFTEEPDPKLTTVAVLGEDGGAVDLGPLEVSGTEVRFAPDDLGEGAYTVTWRTVSRVDGHATAGVIAFGVGRPAALGVSVPQGGYDAPTPLSIAARVLLYAGLGALVGAAWTGAFAFGVAPRGVRRLAAQGWLVAAVGLVALGVSQQRVASVGWTDLVGTSVGRSLAARTLPLACAGLALLGTRVGKARLFLVVAGAAGVAVMFAHVAAGHAGAGSPWLLSVGVQGVHFAAFGVWIGGLAALLVGVRGEPDGVRTVAVRRYSQVAAIALLALALTGILRGIDEVGSWRALVTAGFGRIVVLKGVLVVALGGLGAAQRYRNVPAAASSLTGLRRAGGLELGIAGVVLVATAFLSSIAPPATAPVAAPGVVVTGSDFGTTVRATLRITPGTSGANTYELGLADYDSREPVDAGRVTLRFVSAGRPDIESTAELEPTDEGTWRGAGTHLSLAGDWRVTLVVERGADTVEVVMTVEVERAPQRVTVSGAPGQPDVHMIELGGSRAVQAYVDPSLEGRNEIHATFLRDGGELAIETMTITARGPAGEEQILQARRLTPGHYVAEAELERGSWEVDISATTEDGRRLDARFQTRVS